MYTDLPLDQLRDYRPEVSEPDDFDAFWERTLRDSRRAGGDSTSRGALAAGDVGHRVAAWVGR